MTQHLTMKYAFQQIGGSKTKKQLLKKKTAPKTCFFEHR